MIKAFINSLIPPIIKKLLTNIQTRLEKKPEPEWVALGEGPLKGLRIFIDPSSNLGDVLLKDYDSFIYENLPKANSRTNLVFYDIGAHFGFHTLGFAAIGGETGKVYAFEPHPLNRQRLEKNILGNNFSSQNVIMINKAISDHQGSVDFEMITDIESGWSSSSRILENGNDAIEGGVKKHISVETDSLDNLIAKSAILKPDFIKIDVEGGEVNVLKGGLKTVAEFKPVLFIEIHSIECMYLVQNLLLELGYTIDLIHKETDGRCFIKGEVISKS